MEFLLTTLLAVAVVAATAVTLASIFLAALWVDWLITVPIARAAKAAVAFALPTARRSLPPTLRPAMPPAPPHVAPPMLLPRVPDGVRNADRRRGR